MKDLKEVVTGESNHQRQLATLRSSKRKRMEKRLELKKRLRDKKTARFKEMEDKVADIPTAVKEVHIKGLQITKDEMVEDILKDVLKAQTFGQVFELTKEAHKKLKTLGCFKQVDGYVDQNEAKEFCVTFTVQESSPVFYKLETTTGDNEMNLVFGTGVLNLTGSAEKLRAQQTVGHRGTRLSEVSLKVPIVSYFKEDTNKTASFVASVFNRRNPYAWSNLQVGETGALFGAILSPFSWLKQMVHWRFSWRTVEATNRSRAAGSQIFQAQQLTFPARTMCGHSLSSSVVHKLVMDTRDDVVLPTDGVKASLDQELAGLFGGDVCFFKTDASFSIHAKLNQMVSGFFSQLHDQFSFSFSSAFGLLSPMRTSSGHENDPVSTIDRFKTGGPLSMRGFGLKGICDEDQGFLGTLAYWQSCLQFYFPLPYLRRKNTWIADNLKGHAFLEVGSVGNPVNRSLVKVVTEPWILDGLRSSVGLGMVLRLGDRGRAELNYCVPLRAQSGDRIRHGLQFGIGVEFA